MIRLKRISHLISSNIFINSKNILLQNSIGFSTIDKQVTASSAQDAGGGYMTGESIQPIKMAYTSYESTKPLTNVSNEAPLIIMHGLLGSKSNWNSLSKAIHSKSKLKVLSVDARNHGDSAHTSEMTYPHLAEDIRALMYDLAIKSVTLLGHSMGGRAVMAMALRYPELVDRLIVVDISPTGSSPSLFLMPRYFDAMDNVQLEPHITLSAAREVANEQLKKAVPDKGVRQFILTNLVSAEGGRFRWRLNLPALARNFINIANFPPVGNATFNKPTLFISGGNSDYIKEKNHADIKRLFPRSQIEVVPGAGHWVHSEKPNEFLDIVTEFLNRNPTTNHQIK